MKEKIAGLLLLVLAIVAIGGFCLADQKIDFEKQGKYGVDLEDGSNWIQKITPTRWKLHASLLAFALPAAALLALALFRLGLVGPIRTIFQAVVFTSSPRLFVLTVSIAAFVATQVISSFCLEHTPLTDDEDVYLFQARIIADGYLTTPSHESPEFFDNVFLVNNGRVYGQYPFGHSALLALGVLAKRPSLAPSLLAALSVLFFYLIVRKIQDEQLARMSTLLLLVSPWFLFTSSTLLSQVSALWLFLVCLYFSVKAAEDGSWNFLFLAGIFAGLGLHVRAGDAVIFCGPVLLYLLYLRWKAGMFFKSAALVVLGGAIPLLGVLFLNWIVNGDPLAPNYVAAWSMDRPHLPDVQKQAQQMMDRLSPFGFGEVLWGITHTPQQGALNTIYNLLRINLWLLGLPIALLLFIAGIFMGQCREWLGAMLLSLAGGMIAYFFYFWPGISETGPVHYYLALPLLVIVTAKVILLISGRLKPDVDGQLLPAVVVTIVSFLAIGIFTFHTVQWRALHYEARNLSEPYRLAEESVEKPALVFFKYYINAESPKGWMAGRRNQSPGYTDDILYALDLGLGKSRELASRYPDRTPYRFRYRKGQPRIFPLGPDPDAPKFHVDPDGKIVQEPVETP